MFVTVGLWSVALLLFVLPLLVDPQQGRFAPSLASKEVAAVE